MTRKERIEKMLEELRYEIEVGMLQGDIDESLSFEFIVPVSKSIPNGVVFCSFRTRPMHADRVRMFGFEKPSLKIVKPTEA